MPKVRNIQTGEIQNVTDDQLGVTLASGEYEPEQGSRVAVVNEFGEVGTVDASEVMSGAADQSGMRIATPQEVDEQRKQQEYGDGIATLQAGAEGVARGASVGLSDMLLRNLGVSAEGLRERQERNPIAAGTGEAVGILGSVMLSGGVGGVEQAAGRGALATVGRAGLGAARFSPAGLIARGGMAAERGLAQIIGEGAAAKALTATAIGAAEGGLYGAGEAVTEAALGDHELTAERLLASAGHGAIWGGATGGLMSLVGSGIGAAAKKIKGRKYEEIDRELMQDFGLREGRDIKQAGKVEGTIESELSDRVSKADAVVDDIMATGEQKNFLREQIGKIKEYADGRKALRGLDETLDKQAEGLTRWASRMEEIRDELMYNDLTIASKIKTMAKVVKEDQSVDLRKLADHIEESMQTTMDKYNEVVYDPQGFGYDPYEISTVKRIKVPYERQLHRAHKLVREGDLGDNIEELIGLWDQSKRDLGKIDDALEGNGFGNRVMARDFKEYYMTSLRNDMMDQSLLGEAAKIQQAWNHAFTEDLDVKHVYNRYFLTDAGGKKRAGYFGNVKVGDISKIRKAVRGADQELNLYNSIMRRSAENQANLLDTLSTFNAYVDPKTMTMAKEAREISDKMLKAMDIAADSSKRANTYKKAIEEAEDIPLAARVLKTLTWAANSAGRIDDNVFKGKLQGLFENLGATTARKANVIRDVNKRAESVAGVTRKAIGAFFSRGKRGAAPIVVTQVKKEENLNDRYNSIIKRHDAILNNPGLIAERAVKIIPADIAQNASTALSTSAVRAAEFLKSKQPTPNTKPSDIFSHLSDRQKVADSEIAKYIRYVDGVERPVDAIRKFGESGDMPRETAEAIRTVYPKLFADFETKITEKLVDAKEPLPYDDLMRLSLILNRPLHPSLEGSYIAMCQTAHQQKSKDKVAPSRRSIPETSEHYLSPSQRLAS